MRLYEFEVLEDEFESDDPLRVATTAALSRIKADIEDSGYKGEYKVKSLLSALRKSGVNISHEELIQVSKQEPWSNLIANIKGDRVIFKGDPDSDTSNTEPDDSTDTLKKMANRSEKKHSEDL